jgi:hypothetical protein
VLQCERDEAVSAFLASLVPRHVLLSFFARLLRCAAIHSCAAMFGSDADYQTPGCLTENVAT